MTKKHFIELADEVRPYRDNRAMLEVLARFCKRQNSAFNKQRWLDYIDGKCGPNGGKKKNQLI